MKDKRIIYMLAQTSSWKVKLQTKIFQLVAYLSMMQCQR